MFCLHKIAKALLRNPNLSCIRNMSDALKFTSGKAKVNGIELFYEKAGTGKDVVFLLPGALGSGVTDFSPQMKGLNKEKFTVVSWDPRGYGKSIPPERDFPVDFFYRDAEDAAKLMEVLGFSRYSMLGWSDGGNTAAIVAARHSDKVEKLIVWGSNSFITKEELELYEKIRDVSSWSQRMKQPMIDLYGEEYFKKTWSAWVDGFLKIYHERNGDVYMKELENIKAKTLIIHGVKDAMVPYFQAEHLHKNIKGSQLDCWPEGKHNLHLRYPEKFNAQVENFILS